MAEALREAILQGTFDGGLRLPTTRELCRRLGVNRNTIVAAYRKLEEWNLARPHVGRGTFVATPAEREGRSAEHGTEHTAARPPAGPVSPQRDAGRARIPPRGPSPWMGTFSRALDGRALASLAATYSVDAAPGSISFAGSFPAPDLLPVDEFRRALGRALRLEPRKTLTYGAAQGYGPLREWIAGEMSRSGMPTSPDEVLITNGSQQAIDLIARAFTDPGDLVLLENPTYSGAISSFQSFGARIAGLPLDAEGVMAGTIGGAAARGGGKLLYATPSFQNPTSSVLSLARRRTLLAEAASANLLVIEDDWASGLRFEGEDHPTLRALDEDGRVIYLSTFAKKSLPGLRIGWIAAARPIIDRLVILKQISDCCTSPLVQSALAEFCRSGALGRHLPMVRAAYRLRRDRMLAAMKRNFPAGAAGTRPEGGLFLWVRLPEEIDASALAAEAESRGVLVSSGELFHLDGEGRGFLRLTFATAQPEEIDQGIRVLGSIMKKQSAGRTGRPARAAREAVPLV